MTLMNSYPSGLGESQADSAAVNEPFYATGNVWFVHSETGEDAVAPAGRNKNRPLATLLQAVTNAASGDVIVLMDGHSETVTSAVGISKRLKILGGGRSNGVPTVTLSCDSANSSVLTITADGCEIRNVLFPENVQSNSASKLDVSGWRFSIVGCHFLCGANDEGAGITISDGVYSFSARSCKWTSVTDSGESQPLSALSAEGAMTGVEIIDCTVDDGEFGFSGFWAVDFLAGAVLDFKIENLTLRNGADVIINEDSSGFVAGVTSDGGAVINLNGVPETPE